MIYDIVYKTRYIAKPLGITFNKTDRYIRKYYGIKYLALFHLRYFILFHSNVYSHKYMKIKINSENNLPLERATTSIM